MLTVLSPAKTLDFSPTPLELHSQPDALDQAQLLARTMRNKPLKAYREMMGISDKLARLNKERFQAFEPPFTPANAKQALLAFKGDTYTDLLADELDADQLAFAQQHLRLLSGLYGALRPLDLIQPYRLEMGTRLKTRRGQTLYAFWGDRITKQLEAALAETSGEACLLNLASNEYFEAVKPAKLKAPVVDVRFEDLKNGQYKIISFFAKRARGAMAGWIVRNRIDSVEALKAFGGRGYGFVPDGSSDDRLLFRRDPEALGHRSRTRTEPSAPGSSADRPSGCSRSLASANTR